VKPAAARVQAALEARGVARRVLELPVAARTAEQAAAAVGVAVGQIAKSLVFTVGGAPVMVVASGAHRVDEAALARVAGGPVRRADPETVRQVTGFVIGGVPPVGHPAPLPIYVDRALLEHELIYAAAGLPECVVPLSPDELLRATGGVTVDVAARPRPREEGA
jgi:prolyl-tRNA editing enzyme YbaK/EbsC (Cys-tRNA(Pro) deacylase)